MQQIFAVLDANQITAGSIAGVLGVHPVTLSGWRHGKSSPKIYDLERMAEAIGMRVVLVADPTNTVLKDLAAAQQKTPA